MSVEVKGISEVLKKVESKYGKRAMQQIADKALNKASDFVVSNLKKNLKVLKTLVQVLKK